jgi:hypothetical protein
MYLTTNFSLPNSELMSKIPPLKLDRVGILFEQDDHYFTLIPATPETMYMTTEGVFHGWLTRERLTYFSLASMKWDPSVAKRIEHPIGLLEEWESLSKIRIGDDCLAAVGDTTNWWAAHSETVMAVRAGIAFRARQIQVQRQNAIKVGNTMSDLVFRALLAKEFSRVVDAVYGTLRVKEQEAEEKLIKDVADSMERFTTLLD